MAGYRQMHLSSYSSPRTHYMMSLCAVALPGTIRLCIPDGTRISAHVVQRFCRIQHYIELLLLSQYTVINRSQLCAHY